MANFITQVLGFFASVFYWMSALLTGQDLSSCPVPALFGNNCMNVFNYQECLQLVASGCQMIVVRKSCPASFVCMDGDSTKCPALTDACMNEDNHRQCLELEAAGCEELLTLESCPLQFACSGERNDVRSRSLLGGQQPDACVSLYVYSNKRCTGKPIRELTFPTWSKPGSPCYHDALMDKYSVKDQYCNAATGNWHETVFMGSEDCRETFWSKSVDLTFASDGCLGGVSLKECSFKPCEKDSGDKYVHPRFIGRLLDDEENLFSTENAEAMTS